MAPPMVGLARGLEALRSRARQAPVDHIAWLPGQLDFLRHTGKEPVLYRAGNRMGKSTVGAAELIFRARGKHPYKAVRKAPVRLALVCFSMVQSIPIQRVLWELLGGHESTELTEDTEFSARTGFRGHRPVVQFKNGSEIHIYSNAQGAGALAGSEYHWMLLDEPPAQEVFDECQARVRNTEGGVGITLTPINGPPLPWLRSLCEEGQVRDVHVTLTPESQVSPLTGLPRRTETGRPWDAEFIAETRRGVNPIDAPIRLDGEWEARTEGQFFKCFDPDKHVSRALPNSEMKLALGIDYAAADRELGMCAVLTGIDLVKEEDGRVYPYLYTLDEIVVPGSTTMEVFAKSILRTLQDHSIQWHELDYVFGDIPAKTKFIANSNKELSRYIARELRVDKNHLLPKVMSAKEGPGGSHVQRRTKDVRCRWMYGQIAANRVRIAPRCENLIRSLQQWDYTDRHELKDVADSWMYGLRDLWRESDRKGTSPKRIGVW